MCGKEMKFIYLYKYMICIFIPLNLDLVQQVRILTKLGDDEEVPAFDDIFREDEVRS